MSALPTINLNGLDVPLSPTVRLALKVPPSECFGCFLGDAAPEMHDIPDACEYLNGFILDLDAA